MAGAPQENHTSGSVVQRTLQIASRVKAEPEVSALADESLEKRKKLKQCIRARQDTEDDVFIAAGPVNAAERRTNRELSAFAVRLRGAHTTSTLRGDKAPQFVYVFDGKIPSRLLSPARATRTTQIQALVLRVDDEKNAGPEAKRLARDLFRAISAELKVSSVLAAAQARHAEARKEEEKAKVETVIAVRGMTNAVQAHYKHDPAAAREVLGYGNPAATRKAKAAAKADAAKKSSKKDDKPEEKAEK